MLEHDQPSDGDLSSPDASMTEQLEFEPLPTMDDLDALQIDLDEIDRVLDELDEERPDRRHRDVAETDAGAVVTS